MIKEKKILSYFLVWLIVGLCIIFVGVNDVFAEEVAYSNSTFRVKECGSDEWSNWTNATQKLSIYSVNRLGLRLYFNNTTLNANTYYNISVTYNFYTEAPSINVMNSYGKTTFYYNTTSSENGNIQGNNNNYSVRFEKDTENKNLIKAVYNVLIPVNTKFIAFNINWDEPNKETCRTLSDGFTISNINVESLNDTQAIVDGNNANTENIINNNNQNTQDIINNQNQNNEELKDTIKDQFENCRTSYNLINLNNPLTVTGVRERIPITLNPGTYTLSVSSIETTAKKNLILFWYEDGSVETIYISNTNLSETFNLNKKVNSYNIYSNNTYDSSINFTSIFNDLMLNKGSTSKPYEPYGEEICGNKIDETNNQLGDLNNNITNDNIDNDNVSNSFNEFEEFIDENATISSLITLPVTLFTAILNGMQNSCSPFNLGSLYGEDLILPCINISKYLGTTLWTMIDIIISGFAIYFISQKFIKIFNNFSSMKEGDVIND